MKRSFWVVVVCAALAGCGSRGDVKGTVTFKGEKVIAGTVTVSAANGLPYQGTIDDGTYEIKDVPTGRAKFFVVSQDPKTVAQVTALSEASKEAGGKEKGGRVNVGALKSADSKKLPTADLIPAKYGDMSKEILVYTVTGGSNTFDIKLEP